MTKQQTVINIKKERTKLILGLLVAVSGVSALLFFSSGWESSYIVGDITRIITVGIAMSLSLSVVARQGFRGLFGRAYASLSVGLILWFAAESTWSYYEIGLGEETPFPSIADAFWIASYVAIGYHLFSLSKFFGKGIKTPVVIVVIAALTISSYFYVQSIISISELEGEGALTGLLISLAYPILDATLFIPAILIVLNSGKGQLTSVPWIFIAWILMGIADTMLGFTAVINFQSDTTLISIAYNASYLCFAAGLLWYTRFFIPSRQVAFKT